MAVAVGRVGHDQRLSLVDHLDELRWRVLISVVTLVVAFGFAFWQNHALLDVLNRPLSHATEQSSGPAGAQARFQRAEQQALRENAAAFARLAGSSATLSPGDRTALAQAGTANAAALRAAPSATAGQLPVTLGLAEPFTQTITVSAYFGLLLALPLILYQLYAFVLPAVAPRNRRVVRPLLAMVPALFAAGVAFGYVLVLPAAVAFLKNFNQGQFDALVQAKPYYSFVLMTLVAMGLLFQLPVAILALTRLHILTPRQLRKNRRYAIVVIAIVAALLPGVDPVTTLIEMVPMLALYELSILLASWVARRDRVREPDVAAL